MKLSPVIEPTTTDDDDELWHTVCRCMPGRPLKDRRALCGRPLKWISPVVPVDPAELCNVCSDLKKSTEPRPCCGFRPPG